MKFYQVLAGLVFSSSVFAVDTVSITGVKHQMSLADFRQGSTDSPQLYQAHYTSTVNVDGAYDNQVVNFAITAKVTGLGYRNYDGRYYCGDYNQYPARPEWAEKCAASRLTGGVRSPNYYGKLDYIAEISVSCSGLEVGTALDSKNTRFSSWDQHDADDGVRDVTLWIDRTMTISSACQQLQIDIKGPRDTSLWVIEDIDLSIILAEPF
ncbi:hypothetical protein SG34_000150 [Thalassomonas viridans]|uniref:Ricin B lectin domain-containing protein n=1 Tax=Thalassomonas viridans TaxID=137584 RepID=A0AAF0CA11_9GAMM|nr:hypothetical protein [Thalassomonas viridans]WDE05399.1 hypothetical protein SG34_000150 [Thalassomonas viridans]